MSEQVRVGGYWLSSIAPWGDLNYSTAADGGCLEASWKMDLPQTFTHPALTRGQIVEIKVGPKNVWQGALSEPDASDDWTLTAAGLFKLADHYLAFDGSGNTTTSPNAAVDYAISVRGAPWTKPNTLASAAFGSADSLSYIGPLLNAWSESAGKRWGVDADGVISAYLDPTVPTWHLAPGSGRFGLADDDYASDLYGRYLASGSVLTTATSSDANARAQFGRSEQATDLTSLGILTGPAATAILDGLLAKGAARMGFTNGVTVTREQLTTPGGTPAYLPFVKGGQMVRQFGVINEQGQPLPYVDWVIGETHLAAGADSIALTPVGLVPRVLADVLSVTGTAA